MGLHVGFVERAATGYVGLEVHRAARVAAAAHGGQLLDHGGGEGAGRGRRAVRARRRTPLEGLPVARAAVLRRGRRARRGGLPAAARARGAPDEPARRHRRRWSAARTTCERVRAALLGEGERLVTLTGRGGAGKTSLALVAAAALLDEHPGGVWLTRLASVASPAEVLPAVAAAIGAESGASAVEAIVARLRGRGPALLVLDNFEHLLPAAPEIAGCSTRCRSCGCWSRRRRRCAWLRSAVCRSTRSTTTRRSH